MNTTMIGNEGAVKTNSYLDLETRIQTKQAKFGVIGLGYVGLPLALTLNAAGFDATGIDIDTTRIDAINAGHSYITDVKNEKLRRVLSEKPFVRLRIFR